MRQRLFIVCCLLPALLAGTAGLFAQNEPTPQQVAAKEALQAQVLQAMQQNPPPASPLATGPGENCTNAIPICSQTYTQPTGFSGFGSVQEIQPATTCLLTGETHSIWYVFTVTQSGV
ncbi:MAG: hypothetical protein RMM53_12565, partial [Bacteroidia bacterium]|nr:hypothetical protein [Bacteroidia bacterium]MDW8335040.1 hypothetical protein [Bacteroidia bacterium]